MACVAILCPHTQQLAALLVVNTYDFLLCASIVGQLVSISLVQDPALLVTSKPLHCRGLLSAEGLTHAGHQGLQCRKHIQRQAVAAVT